MTAGLEIVVGEDGKRTGLWARDSELEVRFFRGPRLHENMHTHEPVVLEDVPHVEIKFPADPTKVIVEEVASDSTYIKRFPRQWEAFMAGADQTVGTPLDQPGIFSKLELATMKLGGVNTVEQLLGVSFSAMARFGPGAAEWQQRAQRWRSAQVDGESLRKQMMDMQAELAALKAGTIGATPKSGKAA